MLLVTSAEKTDNVEKLSNIMDFSNYPAGHHLYSQQHKAQLGKFKDELSSLKVVEFCGLRSKTYAFTVAAAEQEQSLDGIARPTYMVKHTMESKCKGVTRAYKKTIAFDQFTNCLRKLDLVRVTQFQIRSKDHKLYTAKVDKLCFSSFDSKRHLFDCGIHSVPYGSIFIDLAADISCPMCAVHNDTPK
jgi:hypothetical protein